MAALNVYRLRLSASASSEAISTISQILGQAFEKVSKPKEDGSHLILCTEDDAVRLRESPVVSSLCLDQTLTANRRLAGYRDPA